MQLTLVLLRFHISMKAAREGKSRSNYCLLCVAVPYKLECRTEHVIMCRVLCVNRNKHKGCCGYTKCGSTGKGVKLSLCMPCKHVGGSGGAAVFIPDLGIRWI